MPIESSPGSRHAAIPGPAVTILAVEFREILTDWEKLSAAVTGLSAQLADERVAHRNEMEALESRIVKRGQEIERLDREADELRRQNSVLLKAAERHSEIRLAAERERDANQSEINAQIERHKRVVKDYLLVIDQLKGERDELGRYAAEVKEAVGPAAQGGEWMPTAIKRIICERDGKEAEFREVSAQSERFRQSVVEEQKKVANLRAELELQCDRVDRLRLALREAVLAAGGVADPEVSDEFLCENVPREVLALRQVRDLAREASNRDLDLARKRESCAGELAKALAEFLRVAELADVPGYIGDQSGWECGECAPMDGSGKRPTTSEVVHDPDCYQGGVEQARNALALYRGGKAWEVTVAAGGSHVAEKGRTDIDGSDQSLGKTERT